MYYALLTEDDGFMFYRTFKSRKKAIKYIKRAIKAHEKDLYSLPVIEAILVKYVKFFKKEKV